MSDHRTVEQIVGERIRQQRQANELTQQELGERLGDYLEKPWKPQAVYEAERGLRAFPAVEIFAFAQIFLVPPGWLMDPLNEVVQMPSGTAVHMGPSENLPTEWRVESLENTILSANEIIDIIGKMLGDTGDALTQVQKILRSPLGSDKK